MSVNELFQVSSFFSLILTFKLLHHFYSKNSLFWISPHKFALIGLGTLILCGAFIQLTGPENVLFALSTSVQMMLSLFHPVAAVAFLISVTLLRPWEMIQLPILGFLPKCAGILCIGSWIFHGIKNKTFSFKWNLPFKIFVALFVWIFLSVATSGDFGNSINEFSSSFLITTIVFVLVLNLVKSTTDLNLIGSFLLISVLSVVVVSLLYTLTLSTYKSESRLEGFGLFANPNDLAALVIMALPLLLHPALDGVGVRKCKQRAVFFSSLHWLLRWTVAGVFVVALWLSQSRGAMLGLFFLIMATIARLFRKGYQAVLFFLLLTPLIWGGSKLLSFSRDSRELSASTESRWGYAVAGLRMALHHPFFGVGFNQYPRNYERFAPSLELEWGERTAHSSWVLILSETGVFGFFFFVSLFFLAVRQAWELRADQPQFLPAILGYGVTMSFLSHTYLIFPYVLFGLIFSAGSIFKRKQSQVDPKLKLQEQKPLQLDTYRIRNQNRKKVISLAAALLFSSFQTNALADILEVEGLSHGNKPLPRVSQKMESTISLKGSRGEKVSFQLRLNFKSQGKESCFPIKFVTGQTKFKPKVTFYQMGTIVTEHPSFTGALPGNYFDPLIPLLNQEVCITKGGTTAWVWGDLEIPPSSFPGNYTSTIQFSTPSGTQSQIAVTLSVWKMTMPDVPKLPGYSELSTYFLLLGHYGKWNEGEDRLSEKYVLEMSRHRMWPLKSYIVHPPIISKADASPTLDLNEKPVPSQAFVNVTLKNRPAWAYFDFPTVEPSQIASAKSKAYFQAIEGSLPKLNRPGRAMIYLWDEPKPENIIDLVKLLKLSKENAPHLKTMVTTTYRKELKPWVDIYVPIMDQFRDPSGNQKNAKGFPDSSVYANLQKQGREVWWYVSCISHGCDWLGDSGAPDFVIERPSSYIRSIAWISHKYRINAFLYYSVNNGYQFFPKRDPWKSLWDFSGNGDGTLFYPGRPGQNGVNSHEPIPSIRLKLWRESSFDAEYLNWMDKLPTKPEWWERDFNKLITHPNSFDHDYLHFQILRDKIGSYLNDHT